MLQLLINQCPRCHGNRLARDYDADSAWCCDCFQTVILVQPLPYVVGESRRLKYDRGLEIPAGAR